MYIRHHEPESRLRRSAVILSLVGAVLFPLAGYLDWGRSAVHRGAPGVLEISGISAQAMWGSSVAACSSTKLGEGCSTVLSRQAQVKKDRASLH